MKRPLGIYLVCLFALLYASSTLWQSINAGYIWPAIGTAMLLIGAAGTFLKKRWAQYLIHAFSLLVVSQWLVYTVGYISEHGWPYYTTVAESIIGLIPGIALCTACIFSSITVFRFFKKPLDRET